MNGASKFPLSVWHPCDGGGCVLKTPTADDIARRKEWHAEHGRKETTEDDQPIQEVP